MIKKINMLDCTLRDGGLGLEDAYNNNFGDAEFTQDDINLISRHLQKSNVDIIELGSIEISENDKTSFAIYQNVEELSKHIPLQNFDDQMYVGLFRGPDTPIEDIPDYSPSLVEGLRVIIRYSELEKSLDFCEALCKKGYKVFVQPMLTMRYTDSEIDRIISASNRMGAYALYFVDSYGYMDNDDVLRLLNTYNAKLDKKIKIGFHAHNNMNLAFSNVKFLLDKFHEREVIIDSCVMGMGQGAGNLQSELLMPYLISKYGFDYDFEALLDACEIVDKYYAGSIWGYSVERLLPALHKTAYKYSLVLRKKYNFSFAQIERFMQNMPDEYRHRYTADNVNELLEKFKGGEAE